jgi:hypothetical protein
MADKLGKSYRIDDKRHVKDGAKVEVWTKGRHKYLVHQLDPKGIKAPATNTITYINREKISASLTDDEVINLWLEECKASVEFNSKNKISNPNVAAWKITQNPYEEIPPKKRIYGETPYYLNNGCSVEIKWIGRIPNPGFDLGTFSNPKAADYLGAPVDRYLSNQPITSSVDDAKNENTLMPVSTWTVAEPFEDGIDNNSNPFFTQPNHKDKPYVSYKEVKVNLPDGVKEEGEYLVWTGGGLQYNTKALPTSERNGRFDLRISNFNDYDEDSRILELVIAKFKVQVSDIHGTNDYRLGLCEPSTETCKLLEYKSPLKTPEPQITATPSTPEVGLSQSNTNKIPLNVEGLEDGAEIKALQGFDIEVWVGQKEEIAIIDGEELDEEYFEAPVNIEEESPTYLPEANPLSPDGSGSSQTWTPTNTNTPGSNVSSGTLVSLPRDYSHTESQGYNLLNNNWIGDLITSAKSHIGHPTYDIEGTEKGNLGCASAVSMIFYRAFGVHMKTGKPVKANPKSINDFGSKGTSELGGWFKGNPLYQQIDWESAQPGDIMNTAKNFTTGKAGHIGIVVDERHKDGSWAIISNSSKGFAGGGGGAVKQNYSVKAWKDVTSRNPTQTFAFRYIGPKLSPGQVA